MRSCHVDVLAATHHASKTLCVQLDLVSVVFHLQVLMVVGFGLVCTACLLR